MIHGKSIFSQCMDLINRENFDKNARRRLADKGSKGFSSWELLVSMMYLQLAQAKSLREIEYGLKGCIGKLRHLGMDDAPKRSTLSYANAHRPWQVFQDNQRKVQIRRIIAALRPVQACRPGRGFFMPKSCINP